MGKNQTLFVFYVTAGSFAQHYRQGAEEVPSAAYKVICLNLVLENKDYLTFRL